MGVIDLDARVKALERNAGGSAEIEEVKTALETLEDVVEEQMTFTSTKREVGVWVDGKTIYEKTFVFTVADFHSQTISSSTMKGQLWTDLPDTYSDMWIDYGNSFLMNGNKSTSAPKSHPLNYLAESAGTSTRTNIQKSTANDGKPFVYFENTYNASGFYDVRDTLKWYIVIRWTEEPATP